MELVLTKLYRKYHKPGVNGTEQKTGRLNKEEHERDAVPVFLYLLNPIFKERMVF